MQDTREWDPWPKKVVAKEVAPANEDASVKVANVAVHVAAVDKEVAAADGKVTGDIVNTAEKDNNVAIGGSKDAGVDGADDGFFGSLSEKELADLELAVQSASKIGNPKLVNVIKFLHCKYFYFMYNHVYSIYFVTGNFYQTYSANSC